MKQKEFESLLGEVDDRGLSTALKAAGYGLLAEAALSFHLRLNQKGYNLTTYFYANVERYWAIYESRKVRPVRSQECVLSGDIYFNIANQKTKSNKSYQALEKLKCDFSRYYRKLQRSSGDTPQNKLSGKIYSADPEINLLLLDLNRLLHTDDPLNIKVFLDKIKEIHDLSLEEAIIKDIGYRKSTNPFAPGYLYIKNGCILKPLVNDGVATISNLRYTLIALLGYSNCKSADSLKKRATSLDFAKYGKINSIPKEINTFKNLKYLSFRGLPLESLPDEIGDLTDLEELNLEFTRLEILPATIGKLKKLKILTLYYSKLTELPDEIGNLTSLEELDLGDNLILKLPSSIGKLRNLKKLVLRRNPLQNIPKEILDLEILTKDDLIGVELGKDE